MRRLRKKLNITQKSLADKIGYSEKTVSKWERGLCFPDISVLIPLTEILNISLYDLLRGEKVNRKEVEETLKDTINYSNSEIINLPGMPQFRMINSIVGEKTITTEDKNKTDEIYMVGYSMAHVFEQHRQDFIMFLKKNFFHFLLYR